jgi:hypothetical protein
MGKLTKVQIDILRKFVDTFDLQIINGGESITFENAVRILEGELPVKKGIEDRRKEFAESLRPHLLKYGADMLNKFYRYWGANDGMKIKFETQKSWNLEQRLTTWYNNDLEWERKKYIEQLNNRI